MICVPSNLPAIFAGTPVPAGPISTEAVEAIARILWDAAEGDGEQAKNENAVAYFKG
jgi:hypothetical protein